MPNFFAVGCVGAHESARWLSVTILLLALPGVAVAQGGEAEGNALEAESSPDVSAPVEAGAEATAESGSEPGAADAHESVAVLEFKTEGLDPTITRNLNELFTSEAGKIPGYKVIGQSEIKDMVGFETQKQMLGCTDESCFSEIGGALGVSFIVSGSVGKVGETFVINVRLIDIMKTQTKNRVGETIAGRVELLTDMIRIVAWKLMSDSVPPHLTAAYDATKARLDAEAARTAGDAAALAAAQKALAEAEKAKAEAEKARAEAEIIKARQVRVGQKAQPKHRAAKKPPATEKELPPPASGGWPRLARNISAVVGGVGLVTGGVLHATSFYLVKGEVKESRKADEGGLEIYEGTQNDAHLANTLRDWAMVGYIVGGVGIVAATVFGLLEPDEEDTATARVVPTANGLLVVF
ncbi:hypothetical protein ACFL6C_01730 [Myxococcota bacterium]